MFLPIFPILMAHHVLHTNPYKMSIFERLVTCRVFFQELYAHIDKNSGEKFEDMFLVKIANKGNPLTIRLLLVCCSLGYMAVNIVRLAASQFSKIRRLIFF